MNNFDPDAFFEGEFDDRGDVAWNEFDWERYLQEQDGVLRRYLRHYDDVDEGPGRIDEVAIRMGWSERGWTSDSAFDIEEDLPPPETAAEGDDGAPYTFHKNPVYIATRALYLSLRKVWEHFAVDPSRLPPKVGIPYLSALCRGEENALLAVQALDFGDYALAVCLLKRAMADVNTSIGLLNDPGDSIPLLKSYRSMALPRLFDLREIWLRVMAECRAELERCRDDDPGGDPGDIPF